ncbi:DedA family protein [Streptomyces sp. YJ-C3]
MLLIGAFIPTLTLLLASGTLARAGDLNLVLVIATASGAVVAGDALGHRTGHMLGSHLRTGRLGRRIPTAAWQRAEALMARRGGQAVFLSRFVPVVRTLTPHLAGATHLPYRRIAPYSLLAAPVWAGAEATTGYVAATSLQHTIAYGGPALAATAAVITAAVLGGSKIRSRTRSGASASRRKQEALGRSSSPSAEGRRCEGRSTPRRSRREARQLEGEPRLWAAGGCVHRNRLRTGGGGSFRHRVFGRWICGTTRGKAPVHAGGGEQRISKHPSRRLLRPSVREWRCGASRRRRQYGA